MKLFFMLFFSSVLAQAYIPQKLAAKDPCAVVKIKQTEIEVASSNISNAETTKTEKGTPYFRKYAKCDLHGNCKILSDKKMITRYVPGHPEANKKGLVKFPNINVSSEMTALIKASEELETAKIRCQL